MDCQSPLLKSPKPRAHHGRTCEPSLQPPLIDQIQIMRKIVREGTCVCVRFPVDVSTPYPGLGPRVSWMLELFRHFFFLVEKEAHSTSLTVLYNLLPGILSVGISEFSVSCVCIILGNGVWLRIAGRSPFLSSHSALTACPSCRRGSVAKWAES